MEAKTSNVIGTRAAIGTRDVLGNGPIPVQADRDLGSILNDLLGQCKQVHGTIDGLRSKLEPIIASRPTPDVASNHVGSYVPTNANELAVSVERELVDMQKRLQELIHTTSI